MTKLTCKNNDADINIIADSNNCVYLETVSNKRYSIIERIVIATKFILTSKVESPIIPTRIKLMNYNSLTFNLLKIRNLFKDRKFSN